MGFFWLSKKSEKDSKGKKPSLDKELMANLEEIHAAIRRRPNRVDDLERKFQKEWIVTFSTALRANRIDNKTPILAEVQLVKKEIQSAKQKNKDALKLKKAA